MIIVLMLSSQCGAAALYQHQPGTELHATANGFPQGPHPQLQQQVLSMYLI